MGLLSEGSPLSWEETKKLADHVRQHGIEQFINLYHRLKDRSNDCLKWGDEVEYMLVKFDDENKRVRMLLDADRVLKILQEEEIRCPQANPTSWKPEYASYMIEGTPGHPYGHRVAHFNLVEANMKLRREEVLKQLQEGETALSLTAFPTMGCGDFTEPHYDPTPSSGASHSLFLPEEMIYQGHPRFSTLTRNIRQRRGEKVAINIPIFKDKETPSPFIEDFTKYGDDGEAKNASKPDHIYMDAMGYGMGCSCLQMTFQACNIDEARLLYDQLNPLCPILLALSAACPIQRGYLADTDCRWDIISASVDCRRREERGEKPLEENKFVIPKSRYASIDSYLSPCTGSRYNDVNLVMDNEIYEKLKANGIDHLLAQHIAHLFIRDPISLFSEKVHQNDKEDTDHFENIQSTNWQTMRFKPPPPNSKIGWRVEFRPTEVQLTDFENAAFVVFIALVTRVILSFRLNFVIPISKVDENMKNAHKKDAVLYEKFYFRKDLMTCNSPPEATCSGCPSNVDTSDCKTDNQEYPLLTLNEIINGKNGEFLGLVPLIHQYLDSMDDCDVDTMCTIKQYLSFIQERASGELMTTAKWMRTFVSKHPDYKQDSIVSDKISYDLVKACHQITQGTLKCPELLPSYDTKTTASLPTAMQKEEVYLEKKRRSLANEESPSQIATLTNGHNNNP